MKSPAGRPVKMVHCNVNMTAILKDGEICLKMKIGEVASVAEDQNKGIEHVFIECCKKAWDSMVSGLLNVHDAPQDVGKEPFGIISYIEIERLSDKEAGSI